MTLTYMDEAIFLLEPILKHGWFLKGSKPSCLVNWSRGKECVFGAMTLGNGGKLLSKQADKINSETFIEYVQYLLDTNGSQVLFMDNAPWHTSYKTSGFLEEVRDCVEPLYLPPYSPELNPVEPNWKSVRSKLANRLFEDTSELQRCLGKALDETEININWERYLGN